MVTIMSIGVVVAVVLVFSLLERSAAEKDAEDCLIETFEREQRIQKGKQ